VKVKKVKDKGGPAKRAVAVAAKKGTVSATGSGAGVAALADGHVEGPEEEKVTWIREGAWRIC
jgi:hypothetical protein